MEENKHKSTHRDTVSAAHALRMRDLHDKRQLLAKLRIAGSEKWKFWKLMTFWSDTMAQKNKETFFDWLL